MGLSNYTWKNNYYRCLGRGERYSINGKIKLERNEVLSWPGESGAVLHLIDCYLKWFHWAEGDQVLRGLPEEPNISPLTTGVGVGGANVADEAAGFYVKLINQWRGNSLSWLTLIATAGNRGPFAPFQPKPDTFVKPWTEGDPFIKRRSVPWHLQHPLKWRCITYFTRWMKRHPSLSRPYETLCS